jgi:membrane protein YqaA with SNARE-associated domain
MDLMHILKAPSRMLRRTYDWTLHWARHRHAKLALFFVAVIEASVFPIPPDALMIPMVVADRHRWWMIAGVCTLGSVLGALIGWGIGWGFYETLGQPIVEMYHLHDKMDRVRELYQQNAFITIVTAAFTPIPYKVITIAAGLFSVPIPVLLFASLVGRAGRFFLVAGLLRAFGEPIARFIEKYFDILAILFLLLLVGGFFALRYLR